MFRSSVFPRVVVRGSPVSGLSSLMAGGEPSRWAGPTQTNNTRFTSVDDWSLYLIPVGSVSANKIQRVRLCPSTPGCSSQSRLIWSHLSASPRWWQKNDGAMKVTLAAVVFFWALQEGTRELSFARFHIFNRWPRIQLPSCPPIRWRCTCHPRIYRSWAPRTTL